LKTVKARLEKYLATTQRVLAHLNLKREEGAEVLSLAKRYVQDALYYKDKRDYVTSLVCGIYAEGLLDALRLLGYAKFEWGVEEMSRKKVMVAGSFDIIHPGHLFLLNKAKEMGDVVVVVARDSTVERLKGRRPVIPEEQRLKVVKSLKPVSEALLGREGDILKIVEEVRPDIILLGPDQNFNEEWIKSELKTRGVNVEVLRLKEKYSESKYCSSSQIINAILSRREEFERKN